MNTNEQRRIRTITAQQKNEWPMQMRVQNHRTLKIPYVTINIICQSVANMHKYKLSPNSKRKVESRASPTICNAVPNVNNINGEQTTFIFQGCLYILKLLDLYPIPSPYSTNSTNNTAVQLTDASFTCVILNKIQ